MVGSIYSCKGDQWYSLQDRNTRLIQEKSDSSLWSYHARQISSDTCDQPKPSDLESEREGREADYDEEIEEDDLFLHENREPSPQQTDQSSLQETESPEEELSAAETLLRLSTRIRKQPDQYGIYMYIQHWEHATIVIHRGK